MIILLLLGETPLTVGSREGHLEIVKYLVDMKANIEAKNSSGGYTNASNEEAILEDFSKFGIITKLYIR